MSEPVDMQYIVKLVREQYPDRGELISALQDCKEGQWTSKGYFQFVDSANANQPHAEWQHKDCVVLEQRDDGDIVIDMLRDGRIGGIEFIGLIDK